MADFEDYSAGRSGSWSPNMSGSAYRDGQASKAREIAPFPNYSSSSPSSSPSYSSVYTGASNYGGSPSYSSSFSSSSYSPNISAGDAEAMGTLVGAAIVIGAPIYALCKSFEYFPNETTFAATATALTGTICASDWVRSSTRGKIAVSLCGLATVGLGIWQFQKNQLREGAVTDVINHVAMQHPQGLLTAGLILGAGLFARTIWNNKLRIALIPAALIFAATALDGISEGVSENEINPLKTGAKSFVDIMAVTSAASQWYIGSTKLGVVLSLPYEASGFAGGFAGDAAVDAIKYVAIPVVKYVANKIEAHMPADSHSSQATTPPVPVATNTAAPVKHITTELPQAMSSARESLEVSPESDPGPQLRPIAPINSLALQTIEF